MLGVEKLKEIVQSVARILNAVSAFVNKAGILSLYPIIAEATALAKMDWKAVLEEVKDLSQAEGDELELAFNGALKLQKPNVQVKIADAINCVQEASQLAVEGYAQVNALYGRGKALVDHLKALVSGPAPVAA